MNRSTETRIIRLERGAGFGRLSGDVSRLSDAELARLIYETTGIPAAEQTDEILQRLFALDREVGIDGAPEAALPA